MYNDLKENRVEITDFFTNACYCDKDCNVRIFLKNASALLEFQLFNTYLNNKSLELSRIGTFTTQ